MTEIAYKIEIASMIQRQETSYIISLIALAAMIVALPAQAASFDCAKANSKIEKMICNDTELSKLDDELSKTYQHTIEQSKEKQNEIKEQRQWLKEIRRMCADVDCLKSAYKSRIHELSSSVGTQDSSAMPTSLKPDCVANMANSGSAYDIYQGVASNYGTFVQNKKFGFGLTDHATRILNFRSDTKLATLCDGKIVAVWLPETNGRFPAYLTARIYSEQFQPVTEEFRITESDIEQWEHSVAPLLSGGFVVTWKFREQGMSSSYKLLEGISNYEMISAQNIKIVARVFDATGKPITGDLDVSLTQGNNARASVYGLPSGGYAVAWISGSGGYLRIFDVKGAPKTEEIRVNFSDSSREATSLGYITEESINLFMPSTVARVYLDKNHAARNPLISARSFSLDGIPLTESLTESEAQNPVGYQAALERLLRSRALVLEHGLREYRQKDVMGFRFCDGTNFYFSDEWMGIINSYSKDSELKKFVANYTEALAECSEWQNFRTRQDAPPRTGDARGAPAAAPAPARAR